MLDRKLLLHRLVESCDIMEDKHKKIKDTKPVRRKKKTKKKKHIEIAKLLEISLIVIFYLFYLFSIIVWLTQDRYMPEMLNYISRPFAVVNAVYLVKSAVENNNRINKCYDPRRKKKISFSTIITLLIVATFFGSVILFSVTWFY